MFGTPCLETKELYARKLRQHGDAKDLDAGKATHLQIISSGYNRDRFLSNLLIQMYGKCNSIQDARSVFASIPRKNVFTWTMFIVAHAQNGLYSEAIQLFHYMDLEGISADEYTYASILDVCASLYLLSKGKYIHRRVHQLGLDDSPVLQTALIKMYGRCSCLQLAAEIFAKMVHKTVISSTAMIAAYAQNGHVLRASELFEEMVVQDLNPDLVAWTAMITANAQEGHGREALLLFRRMDLEGLKPDRFAFVGAIDACASIPSLEDGRRLHARLIASDICCDGVVGNALLNLYAKAGQVEISTSLFHAMKVRNVVTWTALVAAYAQSGDHGKAVDLFREMQQEGVSPNRVTFVSLLFSCSHAGLVDESVFWLASMFADYSVRPLEQHCVCVIDILGRAGRLEEAQKLMEKTGFNSEVSQLVSAALLGFCNVQGEYRRGVNIAERALEKDSGCGPAYVCVSNIFATAQKVNDIIN